MTFGLTNNSKMILIILNRAMSIDSITRVGTNLFPGATVVCLNRTERALTKLSIQVG